MKSLFEWYNRIIKKHKALKRWQRIVTVLAAVITFATTYALILPAITVEKENTDEVAGMYLDSAEDPVQPDEVLEENALIPVAVQIAADYDNAVSFMYEDEEMSAVATFATEEEIPEGAELVVNYVVPGSEEYVDLSSRVKRLLSQESVSDINTCAFYDFALLYDGVDVTPKSGLADIRLCFYDNIVEHNDDLIYGGKFGLKKEIEEENAPRDAEEGLVTVSAEEDEPFEYEADEIAPVPVDDVPIYSRDELIAVNYDESSVVELVDGIIASLNIKGLDLEEDDSVAGLFAGSARKDQPDEHEEDTVPEEHALIDEPYVMTAAGDDYTVKVTCDADSGISDGASLEVSEITKESEEYQRYLEEAKKAMGLSEEEKLPLFAARFFDIKIMVRGKEFIPESGVTVEIAYAEKLAEDEDVEVSALHFSDTTPEPEVIEANVTEISSDGTSNVEFTAESFSVYGVVYTVEFHYDANGKTYNFSIPGGGFVTLRQLVEVLGIANPDAYSEKAAESVGNSSDEKAQTVLTLTNLTISDQTKEFVADVESVEFSKPELLWTGKIGEAATVGQLKEKNALECRNSAELTEKQIEEINSSTVEKGDWALISVQPFISEETLTITMKNGDVFTIKVTDEQLTTYVLSDGGEIYKVTVTYDSSAQIPEDARLVTHLYSEDDEEYQDARKIVEESRDGLVSVADSADVAEMAENRDLPEDDQTVVSPEDKIAMMAFDISIFDSKDNVIEPKSPVAVSIELFRLPEGSDFELLGKSMEVHHLVKAEGEDTETAVLVADVRDFSEGTVEVGEEQAVAKFVTDSFSTFTITWGTGADQKSVTLHFGYFVNGVWTEASGVTYDGQPVDGASITLDPSNPESFEPYFVDGELDLEKFIVPGKTLSGTHRGAPDNLLPGIAKPAREPSPGEEQPHSIVGNKLIWDSTNGLLYQYFYTNSDKAGNGWPKVGYVPYQSASTNDTAPSLEPQINLTANGSHTYGNTTYTPYDYFLDYSDLPTYNPGGHGGNGSGQQGDSPDIGEVGKDKSLTPNEDGTYTLDLSVTTEAKPAKKQNHINIILVVDTSSSMTKDIYGNNTNVYNNQRIKLTKDAITNYFINELKVYNLEDPDTIQMALISFNQYANTVQGLTSNLDTVATAVNNLGTSSGTNWADALRAARVEPIPANDTDDTFVLFLTDGAPSQYWYRSEGNSMGGSLYVDGGGSYLGARDEGRALASSGRELYTIFSYGNDADQQNKYLDQLVDYSYNAPVRGDRCFYADNGAELSAELEQLVKVFTSMVGHTGVNYHDGIALDTTSTALQVNNGGRLGNITYTKIGGTTPNYCVVANSDGSIESFKVGGTADANGNLTGGTECAGSDGTATIAERAYTKISGGTSDGSGGTTPITTEVATASVYQCVADGITYYMPIATMEEDDDVGNLNWDLSPLGMLEDGATYKVSFVVWPDQSAYDYVADLNNGTKQWDEANQIPYPENATGDDIQYYKNGAAGYPNIVYNPRKDLYEVLTNTTQEVTYYIKDQDTGGLIDPYIWGQYEVEPDSPNPMELVRTYTYLQKEWTADRNLSALAQYLFNADGTPTKFCAEFDIFQDSVNNTPPFITVSLGWSEEQNKYVWAANSPMKTVTYNGHSHRIGMRWEDQFTIATGLMVDYQHLKELGLHEDDYPKADYNGVTYYILEEGHDYHVVEKGNLGYEFDFISPIFHPMLLNGDLVTVIFEEEITSELDKSETYAISDMQPSPNNIGSLVVDNTLRAYINLNKIVVGADGRTVQSDDTQRFTYTINLESPLDPGPFTGESVPWYGVNGLFYHTEATDTATGSKTYTYYEYDTANSSGSKLTLKTDDPNVTVTAVTADGSDFDKDIPGPTQIIFTDEDGNPIGDGTPVGLYGNEMSAQDAKHVTAEIQIRQGQTLNIANIPRDTKYTITEKPEDGYRFVRVKKEIKNGDTVESSSTQTSSATITGKVVADRDNNFTYTNKIASADIYVKKIDNKQIALPGAVFQLRRTDVSPEVLVDVDPVDPDLGTYSFMNLEPGTYALVETSAPLGYTPISGDMATFTVTANKEITNVNCFNGVTYSPNTLTLTVPNTPIEGPDYNKLTVRKQWLDENNEPIDYDGTLDITLKQWAKNIETRHTVTVRFRYLNNGNWSAATTRTGTGFGGATVEWGWNQYTTSVSSIEVSGGNATYEPLGNERYRLSIPNSNENVTVFVDVNNNNSNSDPWTNYNSYNTYNSIGNVVISQTQSAQQGIIETGKEIEITLGTNGEWSRQFTLQGSDNLETLDGSTTTILPATDSGRPCYYTIAEPSVPGYTLVQNLSSDPNTPVNSGVIVAYNKKLPMGSLALNKLLEVDEIPGGPTMAKAYGRYNFKVTGPEGATPQVTKYVQIHYRDDGTVWYKTSNTAISNTDEAGFQRGSNGYVVISDLLPGVYAVEELNYYLNCDDRDDYLMDLQRIDVRGTGTTYLSEKKAKLTVKEGGETPSASAAFTNMLVPKMDVPVEKKWNWDDAEQNKVASWSATFNLEYREVLVSGSPASDAKHTWTAYKRDGATTQETITIQGNGTADGHNEFDDLPMYKVHSNGSAYRLIYALDEVLYTINWNDGSQATIWRKGEGEHLSSHYAPDYEQDAGESDLPVRPEEWGDWYKITLTNVKTTREIEKSIDLSLEKEWDDYTAANASDSYAKFQLKRTYHEEWLDYNKDGRDLSSQPLVTVTLDLGNNMTKELVVPKTAPVYMSAIVKPGKTVSLNFNNAPDLTGGSAESTGQQYVTSASSFPADNVTITVASGDTTGLVGGKEGIGLASFDTQDSEEDDELFNEPLGQGGQQAGQEVTLNEANVWRKDWSNLPQVVEEKMMTANGHTQMKTTVYSYYVEEVECYPKNFDASFKDSQGNYDNRMISSGSIVVENKLRTTELSGTKTWNIEGVVIPANPILKLTRTVTMTTGEGENAVMTTSPPEEVTEIKNGETVYLQPTWSGTGITRTFTYTRLPAQDANGNTYDYSVEEIEFTVGTGEDAVTYLVKRQPNGSYDVRIVTEGKEDAEMFTVTQDEFNHIINETQKTTIEILKIDETTRIATSGTALPGASFRLLVHNGNTYVSYNETYGADDGVTVGEDGKLTFSNLPNGEYKIVETHTPSGYIKTADNDIYFSIGGGIVKRYDSAVGTEGRAEIPSAIMVPVEGGDIPDSETANVVADISFIPDSAHASAAFTIGNTPGAALPRTGGPGTKLFYLIGCILTVLAGVGIVIKRRWSKMA